MVIGVTWQQPRSGSPSRTDISGHERQTGLYFRPLMRTALILAGHGSHISPETAGLVWRHVDRLRAEGVADEITAAFWKEKPSFATALNMVTAREVTIVPLFTARGFFTQEVIPAEMGLTGEVTRRDGRLIRYTPPLHEHPYLATVARRRVESARRDFGLPPEQTAVAIIGHSTRRNPQSREATEAQAARLRAAGIAAWAVYLEDTPAISSIYDLTAAPNLIAVPWFLAAGSHTTIDLPRELGLRPGATEGMVRGRRVVYTAPVGVDDDLRGVILALAAEAGMALNPGSVGPVSAAEAWDGFPTAGREALLAAVRETGLLRLGGLRLSPDEVRVWGDEAAADLIHQPAALRQRVREAPFRSLATADDLPRGWRVPVGRPEWLHAIVETIYPGLVADWAARREGTLRVNDLRATAGRQVGMLRPLAGLAPAAEAALVARTCGGCVCHPLWSDAAVADLPCPEPCNHWLSAALEDADLETNL